jgi:cation diffusion facilitator CzcD-associated flavoprotein CzcO
MTARVLVPGCGPLSRPSMPDIPGLASFQGKTFHSARWDDTVPLEGKRVAVIGTGASAIQIVPAIAPRVKELAVFQRTAPWVLPKRDRPFAPWKRAMFRRLPLAQKASRQGIYWARELMAVGFVVEPRVMNLLSKLGRRYLRQQVRDPALRARLTPKYTMGCKRILPTNDYLPALQRSNVELVTDGIAEVRAHSIVSSDGKERPIDALVLATGFEAAEAAAPFEIRGRGGRSLDDAWKKSGAEAYLGTAVAGFPNLFLLIGPNTGLGHSSMIFMIESQLSYVRDAIRQMQARRVRLFDVRPDVQAAYNTHLQERLGKTVWAGGCMSWYLTRTGKNTTLWPGFTFEYRWRTRRFDAGSYEEQPLDQPSMSAQAPPMTTSSRSFTLT